MNFTILSYNIHKGRSSLGTKKTLESLRTELISMNIDILFLQEIVGENKKSPHKFFNRDGIDQLEYLAEEIWPHSIYGKNAISEKGHHGNAILSKFPLRFWTNLDLSTNPVEKRGLLHGIILLPNDQEVHLLCTHLNLTEKGRKSQLKKIIEYTNDTIEESAPLILAGDFNDWKASCVPILENKLGLKEVFDFMHNKFHPTFPSWFPVLSLDRVFCRNIRIGEAKCLNEPQFKRASDHLPLLVQFYI